MRELISLFRELIGKRKLVTELAKADFRKRFVGSYFGIVWMFIQPMVTIAIYAFIFGEHGMKNAPPVPGATYVIWLTPGIIPWFYFSEILNTGTNCLQEYHYLVKKVVFQVEMLPVIKPVSYTHLDVYKRQVLDRAGRKPGSCHDRSCVHAGAGCAADQFDPEFFGK